MRRATGFTLLELLVALGILATLLAVAVPRVEAELPARRLDHAARTLAAETRLARVKAVSRGLRVRVVSDLAGGAWLVEADEGGGFVAEGGERALPAGVSFDAGRSSRIRDGKVSITFQPRGHTADNATIVLTAGSDLERRVIVSTGGRVRIE